MRKDDLIRVRHMLEAAGEAVLFARNRTRKDLDNDRMLTLSIVKSVELIVPGTESSESSGDIQYRFLRNQVMSPDYPRSLRRQIITP